jgi:prepilin-type N-terminal cleavage/methylation domain-containing protein
MKERCLKLSTRGIRMTVIRDNKGFSLPEVMTVVAIIGVMSAVAVPPFLSWLSNKGMQSAARDLYSNMRKAQSFAVKRNNPTKITLRTGKPH